MNSILLKHLFFLMYLAAVGFLFIDVGGNKGLSGYSIWSRPEFWPRIVLIGLSITVLLKLYLPKAYSSSTKTINETISSLLGLRIIFGIIIVSTYCFSTQYLGFAFATMLFLGGFMRYLGQKDLKFLVIMPVISVFFILFVFWRVLYVSLPKGSGIFLDFSNLVLTIVRVGTTG